MKTNISALFSVIVLLFSCVDTRKNVETITLSQEKFDNLSKAATELTVQINCNTEWSATSNAAWCTPQTTNSRGSVKLKISISSNVTGTTREATVTISDKITKKTIIIQQLGSEIVISGNQIPVIFHVLYKEANDKLQNVDASRLNQIIAQCNEMYRDNLRSVNMGIQFVMAPTDANGNPLQEAGIVRRYWSEMPIDIDDVMKSENDKYKSLLWDPNKYINIFLYNFKTTDDKYVILGVSHLPYTTKSNPLIGLRVSQYESISLSNLAYAHCISINSKFINQQTLYHWSPAITVAHELGHYLGLHHVFYETSDKSSPSSTCTDTDYCTDTKSYNRQVYENKYTKRNQSDPKEMWVKRNDCNDVEFISYNIMDYDASHSNQFTAEQLIRVQHVLANSPLIPRLKKSTKTTAAPIGIVDLPLVVVE